MEFLYWRPVGLNLEALPSGRLLPNGGSARFLERAEVQISGEGFIYTQFGKLGRFIGSLLALLVSSQGLEEKKKDKAVLRFSAFNTVFYTCFCGQIPSTRKCNQFFQKLK